MRFVLRLVVLLSTSLTAFAQTPVLDYKNPNLAVEQRVADLLSRMTLEEKIDELLARRAHTELLDTTGRFKPEQTQEVMKELYDTHSKYTARDRAVILNAAQRYQVEKTRLGIPSLFFGEALHGYMARGSTSFPQVLGLASTWDTELVHQAFTAAADEMSATGVRQAFTPVLDLARDPRWGRTEETYGEDPFLVSRMGVAAITGLQGSNWFIDQHHVLATAKHFAVHGQPETGTNTAPGNYSERILRENFLVPFQAAVEEAKVGSVMASYNEIDGIPSHVNPWLLDKILRQEWGFQGYVTSDGGGLQMLVETHHIAANFADAARKAIAAGVELDLSDGSVYRTLLDQVKQGRIPESEIDRAVAHVLGVKFRLGLFEHPYVDPDYAEKTASSAEHRELALKVAQKSVVLLKNEGNLLPLDLNKLKTIAVIGPNALDVHQGGYSREPGHGVSLLQGIRERVGTKAKVVFSEGCKITTGIQGWAAWDEENPEFADPKGQQQSINAAVEVARKSDVAILIVGENESTNREAWSEKHVGDRDSLDLFGAQGELVQKVIDTGVPTIVFLINGRPLTINYAAQHARAIVEGWYLGQEGGTAAANVLFGDVNPGGKLPITFPKSIGQLPAYYNHKPSVNRSYIGLSHDPLFPFGFGLSYTTFKFENVRVEPTTMGTGGTATVRVDVTNTGTREGDEVPQLYIHQRIASVTRPVKELRGFKRVTLKPGEKTTVEFTVTPDALSMLNLDMHRVVEPGTFDLMVGPNSVDTQSVALEVVEK